MSDQTDWRVGDFAERLEDHVLVQKGEVHVVTKMYRGGYLGFAGRVGGEWNPNGWRKVDKSPRPAHREAQPETDGGGEADPRLASVVSMLERVTGPTDSVRIYAHEAKLILAALQPTPEGQTEGALTKERIAAIVEERMMDVWNEIAADTGCHPDDIKQLGRKRLMFTGGHWSRITGEFVASDILAALASKGV